MSNERYLLGNPAFRLLTIGRSGVRCAVLCTCITQLGRILLPNYQGKIINSLIDGNKQAGLTGA